MGEGLFPASFVSKNLNMDPEPCKRAGLGQVGSIGSPDKYCGGFTEPFVTPFG